MGVVGQMAHSTHDGEWDTLSARAVRGRRHVDSEVGVVQTNVLYNGDNLEILRRHYIPDGSVDPIYLDPPFNSNRAYNVIFKDESGRAANWRRCW